MTTSPADARMETLYREAMLTYTVEVMQNLGGNFVPARDLRAIFMMGYNASQADKGEPPAKFEKPKRQKVDYGKAASW